MPRFDIPLPMPRGGVFIFDLKGWMQALVAWEQALHLGESWEVMRAARERRHEINGELISGLKLLVATTSGIVWVNKHLFWQADDIQSQPVIDYTELPNSKKPLCQTFVPIPHGMGNGYKWLNLSRKEKETGLSWLFQRLLELFLGTWEKTGQ